MNKVLILIAFVFFNYSIFCAETPDEKTIKDDLVKRTIVILPFLNKNNADKYAYIAETLRNALKAKIVEVKNFNLVSFSATDAKIVQSGHTYESALVEANAIDLTFKLKADIVIKGEYIIIEDQIMIQIDAVDVFTRQTAISISSKGDVGLDLFRVIDESTVNMTESLKNKFKETKRSYFTEMTKLMQKEQMLKIFTPQVKTGIALCSAGGLLFLSGLPILIYDLAYYMMNVLDINQSYCSDNSNVSDTVKDQKYKEYEISFYTFHSLLNYSIAALGLSIIFSGVGIGLIAYKKKDAMTGFNLYIDNNLKFEFYVRL